MAKPNLQQLLNDAKTDAPTRKVPPKAAPAAAKSRVIHKAGEVNISAYFPSDVKSALRLVQAKTGNNVKQCLAEALADYFRKHNVPVTIRLDK